MGVGWELGLLGMQLYLASGSPEANIPAESSAWGTSQNAKDLMKASAGRWGDADAKGGAGSYSIAS